MDALFAAHSGLRYLVLLAGVIALAWFVWGLGTNRSFSRPPQAMLAIFTGLLDLQILLGITLVIGERRPPGIWGHLALMLAAAVFVHALKKASGGGAGYGRPLFGVAGALALIVMGIVAIGRPIL